MSASGRTEDTRALARVAELLAQLLLHELDAERLARLNEPELRAALLELGLEPPAPDADLDELAADFLEAYVQPKEGGPLVQSLWVEGSYEGECAAQVRRLAQAVGLEHHRASARGAAPDHLGCLLLLWAQASQARPEVAERLVSEHFEWALTPLRRIARGSGFYARLAASCADWIELQRA